ncbi:cytochrome P450 [Gordonia polyisoprenivorans]|uniref:cytochrome P450 n=1 Tax=Gordonia polyisoprenivorans TaxID=84595 RepID=UPI000B99E37D|nr:cytochrome P450 [Gordonia polyisoprenivorans]OZC30128.1 cytochrome P450 [Gordonia polyisoprenivorans]
MTASTEYHPALTGRWFDAAPDAASGLVSTCAEAGPLSASDADALPAPPTPRRATVRNALRFARREGDVVFADAARCGDVLTYDLPGAPGRLVVISDPAHVRSVLTADPAIAPSATRLSPLRPIVGPDSVLTTLAEQHRRQRTALLPSFHRTSVARCTDVIEQASAAHLDRWPTNRRVRVDHIAQAITLDVIMAVIFGIHAADGVLTDDVPDVATTAERHLRDATRRFLRWSSSAVGTVAQLLNASHPEPVGLLAWGVRHLDAAIAGVIAERRADGHASDDDVMSALLAARATDGLPLSDSEIRDELVSLLLAGHETTATTIAWAFERLTRHPEVYAQARSAAAEGDDEFVGAVITETMRCRPVVPSVARELQRPWRFGTHRCESGDIAVVSTLLLHHRDDLYPHPFDFRPDRFIGTRTDPMTLLPFGGGNRRCLGAHLAMTELQIVVGDILRRVELETHDRPAERPRYRNVTMVPARGGTVRALSVD